MERFWIPVILPLAEALNPARIIQAGAGSGATTQQLARFCAAQNCTLDVLDPDAQIQDSGPSVRHHAMRATGGIPVLPAADLLLWDEDRNWISVYSMLQIAFARASELKTAPPVTAIHHTAWPWGRRDSYARPKEIAADDRHPYAARGMRPGISGLCDDGWSGHTLNAMEEGGPRNGVLTAVEDFVAAWPEPMEIHTIPLFHGLTVLIPRLRQTEALRRTTQTFLDGPSLLEMSRDLQRQHDMLLADLAASRQRTAQLGEALTRARSRIAALKG